MRSFTSARGMKDFLPEAALQREILRRSIIDGYLGYGFHMISTPAVDRLELLSQKHSTENTKLMFRIIKRSAKLEKSLAQGEELCDLGLRYDLTVPLVRYYIQHRGQLPLCGCVFKALQVGEVWRAERPQKGRYRQFLQCDTDIIGTDSTIAEYELIRCAIGRLGRLLSKKLVVHLNDRRILSAVFTECGLQEDLHSRIFILLDKLNKMSDKEARQMFEEAITRPLTEKLFTKLKALKQQVDKLLASPSFQPEGSSYLTGLVDLIRTLRRMVVGDCQFTFDPFLARGIEYYTGTIMEVKTTDEEQSIAGGGRYDRLISDLGGPQIPACGFSLGFERIAAVLHQSEKLTYPASEQRPNLAVLIPANRPLEPMLALLAQELANSSYSVYPLSTNNLSRQLQSIDCQGYKDCLIYQPRTGNFRTHTFS